MRVIILAAGQGQRLRPLTDHCPKAQVPLLGQPLIAYQLAALHAAGCDNITLVTGYRAAALSELELPTRYNPTFESTNMVASLMCAADLLDGGDDCLVAYGDIVYEPRIVEALLAAAPAADITTVIDRQWRQLWKVRMSDPLADAETLRLNDANEIVDIGRKPTDYSEIDGQYIGLTHITAAAAPRCVDAWRSLDHDCVYAGQSPATMDMTTFFRVLLAAGWTIAACPVEHGWLEMDSTTDRDTYQRLADEDRLAEFCRLDHHHAESRR